MKILVSGASGLIGSPLVTVLEQEKHRVYRLVRREPSGEREIRWDPASGSIDTAAVEALAPDVVVHLAGESISEKWTEEQKRRVRDSRVQSTRLLAETLARLPRRPKALAAASAIGYYGPRGDEVLTEDSAPGQGFLSEVCLEWEAAAEPASAVGIRVAHLRIGIVLSPKGGALSKMLTPFRLGLGGPFGTGSQWMSWISLDDAVGAVRHAVVADSLRGPANVTAPHPVTNREFAAALGRVLGRPAFLPAPAFALRMLLGGEMADALLLTGQRVEPRRLKQTGYRFQHPDLEGALRAVLKS